MDTITFDRVLSKLRKSLKAKGLRVPRPRKKDREIHWKAALSADEKKISLSAEVPVGLFCENMQSDGAAVPSFLVCIGFWYTFFYPNTNFSCEVIITGGEPPETKEEKGFFHWRRSLFLLEEYSKLFPGLFTFTPRYNWQWPEDPKLNSPSKKKRGVNDDECWQKPFTERKVEKQIELTYKQFPLANVESPPLDLLAQFPVGLFDGTVITDNQWTIARTSEIDLWGISEDGKTLHLFELKVDNNKKVGILPESFYYAKILGYMRESFPIAGKSPISCNNKDWEGFKAARNAKIIIMWLIAPENEYHPFVLNRDSSPLQKFNESLEAAGVGIEFRILPYKLDQRDGFVGWLNNKRWP